MIMTLKEVADGTIQTVCIPLGRKHRDQLSRNERAAIRAFAGLAIKISTKKALPLQVYFLGGSHHLGIHPRVGRIKLNAVSIELNDSNGHKLIIFRDPLK